MSRKYSPGSILVFLKLAGITKNGTPHTLIHIQELLGHSRPETTMIYTQVTRKNLEQIKDL